MAQECNYATNQRCIKAQVSATASIPFPTLFPTPPTFVYGIDELDSNDAKTLDSRLQGHKGPALSVAWWLQFDNSSANRNPSQERIYYAVAFETNSSNPIGGSDNGCGDLLGADCVKNLKSTLSFHALSAWSVAGMGEEVLKLILHPLSNLSCPVEIWGNDNGEGPMRLANYEQIAIFTNKPSGAQPLRGPGTPSGSFTNSVPQIRLRSLEEQSAHAIIGVTIGYPYIQPTYGDAINYTVADVDIGMACLRVGTVSGSTNGGNTKPNAARENCVWISLAYVVAAVVGFWLR